MASSTFLGVFLGVCFDSKKRKPSIHEDFRQQLDSSCRTRIRTKASLNRLI